jgi:hypothetical protein
MHPATAMTTLKTTKKNEARHVGGRQHNESVFVGRGVTYHYARPAGLASSKILFNIHYY